MGAGVKHHSSRRATAFTMLMVAVVGVYPSVAEKAEFSSAGDLPSLKNKRSTIQTDPDFARLWKGGNPVPQALFPNRVSRLDPKSAKKLLEFLDRKKNWMFQEGKSFDKYSDQESDMANKEIEFNSTDKKPERLAEKFLRGGTSKKLTSTSDDKVNKGSLFFGNGKDEGEGKDTFFEGKEEEDEGEAKNPFQRKVSPFAKLATFSPFRDRKSEAFGKNPFAEFQRGVGVLKPTSKGIETTSPFEHSASLSVRLGGVSDGLDFLNRNRKKNSASGLDFDPLGFGGWKQKELNPVIGVGVDGFKSATGSALFSAPQIGFGLGGSFNSGRPTIPGFSPSQPNKAPSRNTVNSPSNFEVPRRKF